MSLVFHQPQSAGELLDVSLNVVRQNAALLIGLGIRPLVALAALDLGARLLPEDSLVLLLVIPLTIGIYSIAEARVSLAAWQLLHREPVDAAMVRAAVHERWGTIATGYALKWLGIVLGLVVVLPGVLLALRWFAVPAATVVERLSIRQGFRRSRDLARGNRRQIFLTVGLLDMGLTLGFLAVGAIYGDAASGGLPLWMSVVSWAFTLVYLPYHGVLSSALYANARMRNEAYDLEERLLSSAGVS